MTSKVVKSPQMAEAEASGTAYKIIEGIDREQFNRIYEDAINVFLGKPTEYFEINGKSEFSQNKNYTNLNIVYEFIDYAVFAVCVAPVNKEVDESMFIKIALKFPEEVINYKELIRRVEKTIDVILMQQEFNVTSTKLEGFVTKFLSPFLTLVEEVMQDPEMVKAFAKQTVESAVKKDES